ncbi:hypothetical protein [Varunaivibrio sulfuroxidans]|uniref:Uncharacterized protein n=1 Tax=Varunaivibrio sulfuroxidans TaxID=1773489 RepID=A0A4R3J430_9PROT|nr:hypothetical protein [Varunaivibrio sulfuroxidans]TCS60599.1 hypothetical protein EDD55_11074 [Varunaivibrio sulfuroxidans]WES30089.1 hypothetical protein P3M64_10635 [Varunaivibrio sulfuroxidans]
MTTILVLDCGLFPDGETLDAALETLEGMHDIQRVDIRKLAPDDDAWAATVRAIMGAAHIVTR